MCDVVTYCVICCGEYPHVGEDFLCTECDNPASSGILDRDAIIETLVSENEKLRKQLDELGVKHDSIH